MRIPLSAKTLLRLHRKFFKIRIPRKPFCSAYSLSFSPAGKEPLVCFRVEKKHPPVLGIVLAVLTLLLAMLFAPQTK